MILFCWLRKGIRVYIMKEVWKGRKLLEQLSSFWSNGKKDSDMKSTGVAKRREKERVWNILHSQFSITF